MLRFVDARYKHNDGRENEVVSLMVYEKETVSMLKLRLWQHNEAFAPSTVTLWSNMDDCGDGWQSGTMWSEEETVRRQLRHYHSETSPEPIQVR